MSAESWLEWDPPRLWKDLCKRCTAQLARQEQHADNSSPCVLSSLTIALCIWHNAVHSAMACHDGGTLLQQQGSAALITKQCATNCSLVVRERASLSTRQYGMADSIGHISRFGMSHVTWEHLWHLHPPRVAQAPRAQLHVARLLPKPHLHAHVWLCTKHVFWSEHLSCATVRCSTVLSKHTLWLLCVVMCCMSAVVSLVLQMFFDRWLLYMHVSFQGVP